MNRLAMAYVQGKWHQLKTNISNPQEIADRFNSQLGLILLNYILVFEGGRKEPLRFILDVDYFNPKNLEERCIEAVKQELTIVHIHSMDLERCIKVIRREFRKEV